MTARTRPQKLLRTTGHRPWPLPSGRWNFRQEWRRALFLHYRAAPGALGALIPRELEPDLFDGAAWVSVVAFTMQGVRPRWLPAWPPVSDFHELNVRTYVRGPGGMDGVYFLSIHGAKAASVLLARMLSVLPYRKADITRTAGAMERFECLGGPGPHLLAEHAPGERIAAPAPLDRWLTERYALYQRHGGSTWCYQVHHAPWPLRTVQLGQLQFIPGNGLSLPLPSRPDLAHWSEGVQVLSWRRELVPGGA